MEGGTARSKHIPQCGNRPLQTRKAAGKDGEVFDGPNLRPGVDAEGVSADEAKQAKEWDESSQTDSGTSVTDTVLPENVGNELWRMANRRSGRGHRARHWRNQRTVRC